MDGEGLMAIKDIEKLTSSNLDIKPLDFNMNEMRRFVHTPKNGVRVPVDVAPFMSTLSQKGFLLFDPTGRPAQVISKIEKEQEEKRRAQEEAKKSQASSSPQRSGTLRKTETLRKSFTIRQNS